jgi:hypothetical protein
MELYLDLVYLLSNAAHNGVAYHTITPVERTQTLKAKSSIIYRH